MHPSAAAWPGSLLDGRSASARASGLCELTEAFKGKRHGGSRPACGTQGSSMRDTTVRRLSRRVAALDYPLQVLIDAEASGFIGGLLRSARTQVGGLLNPLWQVALAGVCGCGIESLVARATQGRWFVLRVDTARK